MIKISDRKCWCGASEQVSFSEFYAKCTRCNTLISAECHEPEFYSGGDENSDLYGKEYWTNHVKKLGFPDIYERSRADLTERSVYWLRSILKYKLPPGKSLELGCAHGGSVFLLKKSGFDAHGAEMSPWLCDFAHSTFDVTMHCGDITGMDFASDSFDIILLMDVLEHFQDPVESLCYISKLLKDDGVLVIQTPCWRSVGHSYEDMQLAGEMFLSHLKPNEHLYLFNSDSLARLLNSVGFDFIENEKPIFAYDMFVFASKSALKVNSQEEVFDYLMEIPERRLVLAVLDLYDMLEKCNTNHIQSKSHFNDSVSISNNPSNLSLWGKFIDIFRGCEFGKYIKARNKV